MTQPDIRRPVVAGAGTMGTTLARAPPPWSGPRPASPGI